MSGFIGIMATHKRVVASSIVTTATLQNSGVISTTVGNPFGTGNAYYFPATAGSYMQNPTDGKYNYATAANPGTSFGTGNFTIEWFEYETVTNNWPRRIWAGTSPSWGYDNEGGSAYWWNPTSSFGTVTVTNNAWYHWAICRVGTSLSLYQNGTKVGSSLTVSTNYTDTTSSIYIGGKPSGYNGEQYVGYMTSIRICTTAVYTGNFTKPSSALASTQSANPYGGSNTAAITSGQCLMLLQP
jgi:hypothetical protein